MYIFHPVSLFITSTNFNVNIVDLLPTKDDMKEDKIKQHKNTRFRNVRVYVFGSFFTANWIVLLSCVAYS